MQELRKTIVMTCDRCKTPYPLGVRHKCKKRKGR